MKNVRVLIAGSVQGVGFRYFVEKNAKILGLTGWVKNIKDGKVEAVFQGADESVDKMVNLCREGPSSSLVKSVEIRYTEDKKIEKFSIA